MQSALQSLPENFDQVNPSDDYQPVPWDVAYNLIAASCPDRLADFLKEFPAAPSLVYYSHSATYKSPSWSRQQRRCYQRINSWIVECWGRGCYLYRVELTSSSNSDPKKLRRNHLRLLRKIKRHFGTYPEFFVIETTEGNGVLHLVWGTSMPMWIPQKWLSDTWSEIHNSPIVWIKAMGRGKRDREAVSRYLVSQYLSGQTKFKRESWSWWRSKISLSKAWRSFLRYTGASDLTRPWAGLNHQVRSLTKLERVAGWDKLLTLGWCVLANVHLVISDRTVTLAPAHSVKFALTKL